MRTTSVIRNVVCYHHRLQNLATSRAIVRTWSVIRNVLRNHHRHQRSVKSRVMEKPMNVAKLVAWSRRSRSPSRSLAASLAIRVITSVIRNAAAYHRNRQSAVNVITRISSAIRLVVPGKSHPGMTSVPTLFRSTAIQALASLKTCLTSQLNQLNPKLRNVIVASNAKV